MPLHWWFHRNYFAVLAITALPLLLATGRNVAYFTWVPVLYVLDGHAWITVLAHRGGRASQKVVVSIEYPAVIAHVLKHAEQKEAFKKTGVQPPELSQKCAPRQTAVLMCRQRAMRSCLCQRSKITSADSNALNFQQPISCIISRNNLNLLIKIRPFRDCLDPILSQSNKVFILYYIHFLPVLLL